MGRERLPSFSLDAGVFVGIAQKEEETRRSRAFSASDLRARISGGKKTDCDKGTTSAT